MGFTSIWHWIVVLAVVLLLFARPGKISGIMGDLGKGLRNFKDGVKGDDEAEQDAVEDIEAAPVVKAKPKKKAAAKKTATKKKAAAKKSAAKKSSAKKASGKKKAAKKA